MSTKAFLFRGDGSDEPIELGEEGYQVGHDELLWIDAWSLEQGEVADLRRALRMADAAAASLEHDPTEVEATVHEDAVEVVVRPLVDGLDGEPTALRLLAGKHWIVTHHAAEMPFLEERRNTIRDDRPVGRLTSIEFLVSMLDWQIDTFFAASEALETEVDALDDDALGDGTDRDLLQRLVHMRRRIARVRRLLAPHRDIFAELARPAFLPDLADAEREALAAVASRLDRAAEAIAHTREMLIGTFDVHMTRTAQRTNDIMRILTLASVILLPSVVVAGVMGMNFKVGLFDEPNLFWAVIGAMALMAVGTLGIARWRGWL
ncbi:MAG TPA: CorA family divalent cation transporter [Candidatus Limnocylindria bacterium]